jgi:uncharacterized protein (DUF2267 family)
MTCVSGNHRAVSPLTIPKSILSYKEEAQRKMKNLRDEPYPHNSYGIAQQSKHQLAGIWQEPPDDESQGSSISTPEPVKKVVCPPIGRKPNKPTEDLMECAMELMDRCIIQDRELRKVKSNLNVALQLVDDYKKQKTDAPDEKPGNLGSLI